MSSRLAKSVAAAVAGAGDDGDPCDRFVPPPVPPGATSASQGTRALRAAIVLAVAGAESDAIETALRDGLPGEWSTLSDSDVLGAIGAARETLIEHGATQDATIARAFERSLEWSLETDGTVTASRSARHSAGSYYTPDALVQAMVADALPSIAREHGRKLRVLDPACGAGAFLAHVLRELVGEHGLTITDAAACLAGVDVDAQAVWVCRRVLLAVARDLATERDDDLDASAIARQLARTIRHGDALLGDDVARAHLVIGNPPYTILRSFKRNPHWADYATRLRASGRFSDALAGNIQLGRLFLARGRDLVVDDGTLCFLVPVSVLLDRTAGRLRRRWLEQDGALRVTVAEERDRPFADANTGVAAITLDGIRSGPRQQAITMQRFDAQALTPVASPSRTDVTALDPATYPIPLATQIDFDRLHAINAATRGRLGDIVDCGVGEIDQTLKREHMLDDAAAQAWFDAHRDADADHDDCPILLVRGDHVRPFAINLDRNAASGRERWVRRRALAKATAWTAPRVGLLGIRNMATRPRLVSAPIPAGIALGNSVDWYRPRKELVTDALDAETWRRFLLGLLNSELMDWRFRLTSGNNNINQYEVRALPLPFAVEAFGRDEAAIEWVRAIATGGSHEAVAAVFGAKQRATRAPEPRT